MDITYELRAKVDPNITPEQEEEVKTHMQDYFDKLVIAMLNQTTFTQAPPFPSIPIYGVEISRVT